jgi:hypothetical protein
VLKVRVPLASRASASASANPPKNTKNAKEEEEKKTKELAGIDLVLYALQIKKAARCTRALFKHVARWSIYAHLHEGLSRTAPPSPVSNRRKKRAAPRSIDDYENRMVMHRGYDKPSKEEKKSDESPAKRPRISPPPIDNDGGGAMSGGGGAMSGGGGAMSGGGGAMSGGGGGGGAMDDPYQADLLLARDLARMEEEGFRHYSSSFASSQSMPLAPKITPPDAKRNGTVVSRLQQKLGMVRR